MKPTVGRIVRYQTYGTPEAEYDSESVAALVTNVWANGKTVDLAVFYVNGLSFKMGIEPSSETEEESEIATDPEPGCWNWPPRS